MKVGDLVKVKNTTELGLLMYPNKHAEPSIGICWYVFFTSGKRLAMWESQLEVINESR
jgi:hypothetical protein